MKIFCTNRHLYFSLPFSYVLAPYSLRIMVLRYHDALLFALLLPAAAVVYALGGVVLSGAVAVLYTSDPFLLALSLLPLGVFSLVYARYVSGISEYLGHRTYMSPEELLRRGVRMFLLMAVLVALSVLSVMHVPYVGPLLSLFLSLCALTAGTIIAVDGAGLLAAMRTAAAFIVGRAPSFAEFLVLSFLLFLPVVLLDVYGGWFGSLLSLGLLTFFVVPWLSAELALIYLCRYPLVGRALRRLGKI